MPDVAVHAGGPPVHGAVCVSGAGVPCARAVRVHGGVVAVGGVRRVPGGAADAEGAEQGGPGGADADSVVAWVAGGSVLGGEDEACGHSVVQGNCQGRCMFVHALLEVVTICFWWSDSSLCLLRD